MLHGIHVHSKDMVGLVILAIVEAPNLVETARTTHVCLEAVPAVPADYTDDVITSCHASSKPHFALNPMSWVSSLRELLSAVTMDRSS